MPCPDCEQHATPEQINELLAAHSERMQRQFDAQLKQAVAELLAQISYRPAHETIH